MNETSRLADLLLALCRLAGPTQTVDPTEVAQAFAGENGADAWPNHLQGVRNAAVALAREGRIIIYQKGAPADPDTFRGLYRLGCPNLS